ncbi:MAG: hypothetical protein P1U87_09945 [Verrucomicrobiales bacterium]|nr:hypothetical protein [Verrucomicrobiales bacterium]
MTRTGILLFLLLFVSPLAASDFQAGSALEDITPPLGVPLDGAISQNGPVVEIHDPPHVRAVAFSDGRETVVLATVDNTMISGSIFDRAKERIKKETGIPGSHIILAATHTHSTPRGMVGLVDDSAFDAYLDSLPAAIAKAVINATKNLQPAQIGWAGLSAPEHVHNRRWHVEPSAQIKNPFGEGGEVVRMNPGREGLIKPAGPVDPELTLLSVQTESGKPLSVMGNYGLHYVGGTGRGKVSADYFAVFSEAIGRLLEADESFVGLMSNGTSGDVNAVDFSSPPPQKYAPFENLKRIGEDLAERAAPVIRNIEHRKAKEIRAVEIILNLKVRKPDAERLAWAKETAAPPNSPLRLTRTQVYAREALALSSYPDMVEVKLQAIRIDDFAVVGIPCEVFAETGLAIKEAEVFPHTIVMELANGYHGYLPTAQQHEWGGYETWPARSACLEEGAESEIRKAAIQLLKQLRD